VCSNGIIIIGEFREIWKIILKFETGEKYRGPDNTMISEACPFLFVKTIGSK
jgi:hypothetical protein